MIVQIVFIENIFFIKFRLNNFTPINVHHDFAIDIANISAKIWNIRMQKSSNPAANI